LKGFFTVKPLSNLIDASNFFFNNKAQYAKNHQRHIKITDLILKVFIRNLSLKDYPLRQNSGKAFLEVSKDKHYGLLPSFFHSTKCFS
jgi:hypothetical protein